MTPRPAPWLFDALNLQLAWFSAALLQDGATAVLALLLALRLALGGANWRSLKPALWVAAAGLLLELSMLGTGLSRYNSAYPIPAWLPLLWLLFGLAFERSLNWLLRCPLPLQAALGAGAGTLSYLGADAFEVLQLAPSLAVSALCLGILWSVALPLFAHLYEHAQTGGAM